MPYQLKTTGLALNLVFLLAVDDDGTTIREFVSSSVNSNKTFGTGVAASVATGAWKGTARKYWSSTANGSADFHGVKFATGFRPSLNFINSNGWTLFEALHSVNGVGSTKGGLISFSVPGDAGDSGMRINSGTNALYYSSGNRGAGTATLPIDSATKYSIAASYKEGASPSTRFHYGLESGSLAADGTAAISGWAGGSTGEVFGVGGFIGGNQPASRYASMLFNKELSLAEAQSLHDDWFATLFDVTAAPVITGPTGAAGAVSITHTVNELQNAAGTWTVTDGVSWSLTGTDAGLLSISGGVVTKATGTFDFEAKSSYSFNVVNGSASQAVTLNITNLPELSAPTKSTPAATSAIIGCTVDTTTGTLHGVLTLDNSAPSAAQVKAGQDAAGSSATTVVPADLTITSAGVKSLAAATVVSGTTRYGWLVLETGGNDSTVLATGPLYPGTGRPVADVSVAGWAAIGAASISAALNTDTSNRSTYAAGPAVSGSPSLATMELDKPFTPGTYSVSVDADMVSGTGTLRVKFFDGSGTLLGTSPDQTLTATATVYTFNVTISGGTATRWGIETQS